MYAKRFNELVIVTTAPYRKDHKDLIFKYESNELTDVRFTPEYLNPFDSFGSADCSCDICNGQN